MKFKIFYFFSILILVLLFSQTQAQSLNCSFKRNLSLGSRGQDVLCLQNYLKKQGLFPYSLTGVYDLRTRYAVKKWQELNKIYPANGNFDLVSRFFFEKNISKNLKFQDIEKLIDKVDKGYIIVDETNGLSKLDDYYQIVFFNRDLLISSTTFINLFSVYEPFSLVFLIDKTINFSSNVNINLIKEKNDIFKNFFAQRINQLKKISVKSNLKNFHLAILLNDLLSLDLSSKFEDYLNGKISLLQFRNDLENFNNQLNIIREKYVNSFYNQAKEERSDNFISSLVSYFLNNKFFQSFLIKQAKAFNFAGVPFGGRITHIIWCPCSGFSRLIYLGPPLPPPLPLYAPLGIEATPVVYMWKNLYTPGVWLLGLYLPSSIPCLQFAAVGPCFPIGFGEQILMVGTSLTP